MRFSRQLVHPVSESPVYVPSTDDVLICAQVIHVPGCRPCYSFIHYEKRFSSSNLRTLFDFSYG